MKYDTQAFAHLFYKLSQKIPKMYYCKYKISTKKKNKLVILTILKYLILINSDIPGLTGDPYGCQRGK